MTHPDPEPNALPPGHAPAGHQRPTATWVRRLIQLVVLVVAYVASARLGLGLDAYGGYAALVWPPSGIALAALLLGVFGLWPGVLLGAVIANRMTGAPLLVALGIGVGNTLEAIVAVWLLRDVVCMVVDFRRVRDAFGLIVVAVGASTISAAIGVASLVAGGVVPLDDLPLVWQAWWLGDVLGALVVAPLLLAWSRAVPRMPPCRWIEALGLALAVAGTGFLVFFRGAPIFLLSARPYLVFPVLVWAAIRFGPRGATAATLAASVMAVWATALGSGPFVEPTLGHSLFALQGFTGVAAVTTLLLAAAVAERGEQLQEKAREELLAVVSHDLKNPLNAIRLSTAWLLKQPPQEVGEHARKQLEVIERSTGRMSALANRLLDEASLRMGGVRLKCEREDLVVLLQEVAEMMRPTISERAETLRIEVPPTVEVKVDRERLLQVLSNILGNAVKFTPVNGTITARVQVDGSFARCTVTDTGPGVEPEQLRHVFEPYWTGDPSAGTGLGLSIAKRLVEAHGGQMWFQSSPGAGATVGFTVPLA